MSRRLRRGVGTLVREPWDRAQRLRRITVAQVEIVRRRSESVVFVYGRLCEYKECTHTPERQYYPKSSVSRVGELLHDRTVKDKYKD